MNRIDLHPRKQHPSLTGFGGSACVPAGRRFDLGCNYMGSID